MNTLIFTILMTAATQNQTFIDMTKETSKKWRIINDGVMGGLSTSKMTVENNIAVFKGILSLKNNGGFASTRRMVDSTKLKGAKHIVLTVIGDGREYQFRVRPNKRFDGVSFTYPFTTEKDKEMKVKIPVNALYATYRGYKLKKIKVPPPEMFQQIGFLLGDKKEGAFKLKIKAIDFK